MQKGAGFLGQMEAVPAGAGPDVLENVCAADICPDVSVPPEIIWLSVTNLLITPS